MHWWVDVTTEERETGEKGQGKGPFPEWGQKVL